MNESEMIERSKLRAWQINQARRLARNRAFGYRSAAVFLRANGWSLEAALYVLLGAAAVRRLAHRLAAE